MKLTQAFFSLLLSFTFLSESYAAHGTDGHQITIKNVDSLVYDVTLTMYRYCGGTPFLDSFQINVTHQSRKLHLKVWAKIKSIRTSTPVCRTATDPCNPSNTRAGDGLERHDFTVRVDFTTSPFDSFVKLGEQVYFEHGLCCRNSSITTGAGNKNLFNYAMLDLTYADNSSAEPMSDVLETMCCNQPYRYNLGTVVSNGDSISYAMVKPLSAYNKIINTSVPIIEPYYPSSLKYPYTNASADPPIGLTFDSIHGGIIVVPTRCSQITTLVFEMTTWRKDTSGNYKKSTIVRRDEMVIMTTCRGNNPPVIKAVGDYEVCEDENLAFGVTTSDKAKVPPPPLPTPDPDTTTITILNAIDGATYTFSADSIINQRMNFSWTPKEGKSRSQPYSFTVVARDNACPLNRLTFKTIRVFVRPKLKGNMSTKDLACNTFEVTSIPDRGFAFPATYSWQVMDTFGTIMETDVVYFPKSRSHASTLQKDTMYIRKSGTYVIKHTLQNTYGCEAVYFDTVTVSKDIPGLYTKDELITCKNDPSLLSQDVYNDTIFSGYQWSTGDTSKETYIKYTDSFVIYLRADLKAGCFYFDDIVAHKAEIPKITLQAEKGLCLPIDDSISISLLNRYPFDTDTVRWNGSVKDDTLRITRGGKYVVNVANFCGSVTDSVTIETWDKPDFDLSINLDFFCDVRQLTLQSGIKTRTPSPTFWWENFPPKETLSVGQLGTYVLRVENLCGSTTDSIEIKQFYKTPVIDLGPDTFICDQKNIKIQALFDHASYLWSTGDTSVSVLVDGPKTVWVEVTTSCGVTRDTVTVQHKFIPKREMPRDTFFCDGDNFYLNAGNVGSTYIWDGNGERSRRLKIDSTNTYSVHLTNACGSINVNSTVVKKYIPVVDLGNDSIQGTGTEDLDAGNPGSDFSWSSGHSSQRISVNRSGWYWVDVTNVCGTARDSIYVGFTGIEALKLAGIKMYPNPTTGIVLLEFEQPSTFESIQVYNAIGEQLLDEQPRWNGRVLSIDLPEVEQLLFLEIKLIDHSLSVPVLVIPD